MNLNYRVLWRSLFWLLWIGVTVLFLLPSDYLGNPVFDWWDKAQHALVFLVLLGLAHFGYETKQVPLLFALMMYGGLIEVLQSTLGWRQGDWFDWLADAAGDLLGSGLIRCFSRQQFR